MVQIEANPIVAVTGGVARTGPLNVAPGGSIEFRIGVLPSQTAVYVR